MIYIVSLVLIIIEIILCFKNIKKGLCIIIIITFLIPNVVAFPIGGVNLNVFNISTIIFLLFSLIYTKKHLLSRKIKNILIFTISYFYITALLSILPQYGISFYTKNVILNFLEYYALGIALLYIPFKNNEVKYITITISILVTFESIYAIFNYFTQSNPYLTLIILLTGAQDMITSFLTEQRGALTGRVSGTFMHPLILGEMMLLSFSYLYYQLKTSNIISTIVLSLCALATIFTASRAALFPLILVPIINCFFNLRKNIFRYILYFSIFIPIGYSLLPKDYKTTIDAMVFVWDTKKSENANIGGSSINMRNDQFNSALKIVKESPLLGKGNGYVKNYGDKHPEMLGYESLFLYFIVEYGILGLSVFCIFYYLMFYILWKKSFSNKHKAQTFSLCGCFFICILLTGIQYSVFTYFMLLYFLTYNSIRNEKLDKLYIHLKKNEKSTLP